MSSRVFPVRMALALFAAAVLLFAPSARADVGDEQALAERYAPIVRIVQPEECGHGEPYRPIGSGSAGR